MAPTTLLRLSTIRYLRPNPQHISIRSSIRPLSHTSSLRFPRKDSQDRNSINTDATEYSKSGTDDLAAHEQEAAFDPDTTDPKAEKKKAGEGNNQNPLEVSPANPDVSKQGGKEAHGGEEKGQGQGEKSGGGSPPKSGKL